MECLRGHGDEKQLNEAMCLCASRGFDCIPGGGWGLSEPSPPLFFVIVDKFFGEGGGGRSYIGPAVLLYYCAAVGW